MDEMPEEGPIELSATEKIIARTLGPQIVVRLSALLRCARLYDTSHQVVQTQMQQLLHSLEATREEEVALHFLGQHSFINGIRLKPAKIHLATFAWLAGDLESRALGGFHFYRGLLSSELENFLRVFLTFSGKSADGLREALGEVKIQHLIPVRARELGGASATASDERSRARKTMSDAVSGCRMVFETTARTRNPALREARRVVQPLVDTLMRNENSILGLAALKNHDEYTYAHCVNVSLLSIAIGHSFGLPRTKLADLGVAALIHDLGKLAVPADVLHKPGRLTNEEWTLIQRHPLEGVKLLSRHYGLATATVEAMRVCLLHHQTLDRRGYPEIVGPWRHSMLARIVAAADCFDAMTAHRAYRHRPMTGFEALRQIIGRESAKFDPAVLWMLVSCVGLYPAGTIMVTKSGHTVLSLSPNPADPERPFCQVLKRPGGSPLGAHETVTWDPMPESESVLEVVAPDDATSEIEEVFVPAVE